MKDMGAIWQTIASDKGNDSHHTDFDLLVVKFHQWWDSQRLLSGSSNFAHRSCETPRVAAACTMLLIRI
jgi:hypothetical protein